MANQDDVLLTTKEAARLLGIKENTLAIWRNQQRYNIPYIKVGRTIRYKRKDIIDFLRRQTLGV